MKKPMKSGHIKILNEFSLLVKKPEIRLKIAPKIIMPIPIFLIFNAVLIFTIIS